MTYMHTVTVLPGAIDITQRLKPTIIQFQAMVVYGTPKCHTHSPESDTTSVPHQLE